MSGAHGWPLQHAEDQCTDGSTNPEPAQTPHLLIPPSPTRTNPPSHLWHASFTSTGATERGEDGAEPGATTARMDSIVPGNRGSAAVESRVVLPIIPVRLSASHDIRCSGSWSGTVEGGPIGFTLAASAPPINVAERDASGAPLREGSFTAGECGREAGVFATPHIGWGCGPSPAAIWAGADGSTGAEAGEKGS